MLELRLLFLVAVVAAAILLWAAFRWRTRRFRRPGAADLLASPRGSRALVIAFTTPACVPCRTVQKPALEQLRRRYPNVFDIREVDATLQPELAERFGILSVPSTVVVDPDGRVLAINHTLAVTRKLAAQLGLNGTHPLDDGGIA